MAEPASFSARSLVNIIDTYELKPGDRSLLVMPLFHVHGLMAGEPSVSVPVFPTPYPTLPYPTLPFQHRQAVGHTERSHVPLTIRHLALLPARMWGLASEQYQSPVHHAMCSAMIFKAL